MIGLPQVYNPKKKCIHKEKQTSDGHGETTSPTGQLMTLHAGTTVEKRECPSMNENQINETRYAKSANDAPPVFSSGPLKGTRAIYFPLCK